MRFLIAASVVIAVAISCVACGPGGVALGDDCVGVDGGPCGPPPDAGDATVSDGASDAGHDATTDAGGG
jgi:hypothetical protein